MRHPAYLAGELVLATVILLLTGVESPFFYYTLATALLGGLLYGWPGAILFSPILVGVYYWVVSVRADVAPMPDTFQADLGQPILYLRRGGGRRRRAAAARPQAAAEDRIAAQERHMAAEAERSRLARDMHDSLAKTVSGIGFAALGLARRIERDPQGRGRGGAPAGRRRAAGDA